MRVHACAPNFARMSTPYSAQPRKAFWRTGVADEHPLAVQGLYEKRFALSPNFKIATAGSCFAQHVARALRASGFGFLDVEPPPPMLSKEDWARFGYGLYSARFGNVYTVRQMLQLFERAFGKFIPLDRAWQSDKGVFDPFRPTIQPNGFASQEELEQDIEQHFAKVREMFKAADVLIFTLGLTEAWVNSADGAVYPSCPGALAGTFDSARHKFVNFTFADVYGDLRALIQSVRDVNPEARFIFTVSPVPLTATATDNHVLVASSYSKAVLRAAVGQIYDEFECVDYFPSYEVISSHPFRGFFFEANMRSVAPKGVEYVMSHFFAQHGIRRPQAAESVEPPPNESDVWCDEEKLESLYT